MTLPPNIQRAVRVSAVGSFPSFSSIMPPYRNLHWSSLAILATGLLPVGPVGILAQTSDATCLSTFGWVRRSAEPRCLLSNCLVARWTTASSRILVLSQHICKARAMMAVRSFPTMSSLLHGSDVQLEFTVPALPPGTHYTGPYADQQNVCQCSSVTYNTVSACGLCQNHTIIR